MEDLQTVAEKKNIESKILAPEGFVEKLHPRRGKALMEDRESAA